MEHNLHIYNTLSGKKEKFTPLSPPFVGMYVCGPTVYGDAHLGHARAAVSFDIVYRYLKFLKYKVRYVRNITDVGHLVNDADEGEDKIAKRAKLEQTEPMEIVQKYTNSYHRNMLQINTLEPSIEPSASGHILEQIALIKKILQNGYAYESNGSVYFDVPKYAENFNYGELSGRKIEDLQNNTRQLSGQDEKKSPLDFALWKKAAPEHIMRWPSEWSEGFPGWHLECSTMGRKYLGEQFDIHGGGVDLKFPHHECEIAQNKASGGKKTVKYWMHNNLITINGQKMSKSLQNFITLDELFSGQHPLLQKAYSPQTFRFFILRTHYRKPLDFSEEALQASEKSLERLLKSYALLSEIEPAEESSLDIQRIAKDCFAALDDDFNTPTLFAILFETSKKINLLKTGEESLIAKDLDSLKNILSTLLFDILGLEKKTSTAKEENNQSNFSDVMSLLLEVRKKAKEAKDYTTADHIRAKLEDLGIKITDTKSGTDWSKDG